MPDPFDEFALRAAINVLRDSIESGRMPSGLPLAPDAADLHERAADHLAEMLKAMPPSLGVSYETGSYLQGLRDAYNGLAPRHDQTDPLAYSSGRVEGEAARLSGQPLAELLEKARLPHLVDHKRPDLS